MLDQGQTITVSAVPQVYNLTQFDKYRTERVGTTASGEVSKVNIDHTPAKTDKSNDRHLHQYVEDCTESETGEKGQITINSTISAPKWADKTRIEACLNGMNDFVEANIARTLNMES